MKKLTKGTALLFAVLLTSIMLFSGCDTSFNLGDATRIDKELTIEAGENISLSAGPSHVSVGVSPDDKVYLTYYVYERVTYTFIESNGGFSLTQKINGNVSGNIKGMTVLVPTGVTLGTLSTFVTSGGITLTDTSAKSVEAVCTSGNISITGSSATGTLSTRATSGDITLTNTPAETIEAVCTSGNIRLNELSSNEVSLSVTSGNINGSIKGNRSDFTVNSSSTSGFVNIQGGNTGGSGRKKLTAHTTSGSINITFTE